MQRDNLEQFIFENRESFDDATPSLKVWGEIDRAISAPKLKTMKLRSLMRIAAAIALLLITGGVVGSYLSRSQHEDTATIIDAVAPEYMEMEQYYQDQINTKVKQLTQYDPNSPVLKDLKQMDQAMTELKDELKNAPKGKEEEIVATMIQTYQTKVAILERVLEYMRQAKPQNSKSTSNEISM
jgi:hypothetical protein